MAESTCFIALGSNLGDRLQNLSFARERLSEKVKILKSSSI
ncbi:MAG TPA: 2-amino-4-hydroxy-6-hydroxymethyldihydropteridine diphosphokinase, partial [Anaerolineaceae bacterium]|nr:2-amino-4-hydroxy-6-hydroxymethyldihydropteridine diphosphokinase [Anaerolineaceae bacterium]